MTKEERSWILYDWANSAYSIAITTAILPIYFKDVAAKGIENYLSTAYWGYGTAIATLLVAVLAPILGTIADYRGYKKRFLIFFFAIGVIFTAFLSIVGEGDWLICLALYVMSAIGFACANIFYDSFLVDVTDRERMDWVSSCGFGWGYFGSTIPFLISIGIIVKPSIIGLHSSLVATRLAFCITAFWWLIFSIPLIKNVRQVNYIEPSKKPVKDSIKRLISTVKDIRQYKNIFIFLLAYFLYIDGVDTIIRMAAIYGRDIGISASDLLVILLVIQFIAFPFALVYGKLAQKFSTKTMLLVGIGVYTCITIYAYFLQTVAQYWVLAILVATSQGGIQALSRAMFGNIIPKKKSAEFFGFYNIFGKFAAIIGPLLVALCTHITGNSRIGIISLILLFIAGGFFLSKVKNVQYHEK